MTRSATRNGSRRRVPAWCQRLVTRAWPRRHIAPNSAVGYVVRINKGYWERLTILIVSRNSVFGFDIVQDALVASLANLLDAERDSPRRTQQPLGAALRRMSAVTADRELGILDFADLPDLAAQLLQMGELIAPVGPSLAPYQPAQRYFVQGSGRRQDRSSTEQSVIEWKRKGPEKYERVRVPPNSGYEPHSHGAVES